LENLFLQDPDALSIDHTYRSMPKLGDITLSVQADGLESTLKDLEKTGFVGMTIAPFSSGAPTRKIRAFKGKHGPCYDKGEQAVYLGEAAAALDDDHHLLLQSEPLPVCEKTSNVLTLPPYEKLIRYVEPGQKISADQPKYFKYDHVEDDQEKLLKKVGKPTRLKVRIPLFYPGPFRLLILADGTIVRRGKVTSIPDSEARKLMKKDGLFRIDDQTGEKNEFYQEEYARAGTKWMFDDFVVGGKSAQPVITDFTALPVISVKMKERLLQMIEKQKSYFLLSGSDPADRLGCCPSDEVAEANRLVQAGILESCSQADYVNSCPVTFYAFKGEIKSVSEEIEFMLNPEFREEVLGKLIQKPPKRFRNVIKWAILAFVAISVLFGIYKMVMNSALVQDKSFFERLASANGNQKMVLLFHYHKRCYQCLNMEKYTHDVLQEDFQNEMEDERLSFKLIDMDLPENRQTVKEFGFISPMIVLVDLENGKEKKVLVVGDAWKLFDDEQNFKALIRKELGQIIGRKND
jgi:hypothetical protein